MLWWEWYQVARDDKVAEHDEVLRQRNKGSGHLKLSRSAARTSPCLWHQAKSLKLQQKERMALTMPCAEFLACWLSQFKTACQLQSRRRLCTPTSGIHCSWWGWQCFLGRRSWVSWQAPEQWLQIWLPTHRQRQCEWPAKKLGMLPPPALGLGEGQALEVRHALVSSCLLLAPVLRQLRSLSKQLALPEHKIYAWREAWKTEASFNGQALRVWVINCLRPGKRRRMCSKQARHGVRAINSEPLKVKVIPTKALAKLKWNHALVPFLKFQSTQEQHAVLAETMSSSHQSTMVFFCVSGLRYQAWNHKAYAYISPSLRWPLISHLSFGAFSPPAASPSQPSVATLGPNKTQLLMSVWLWIELESNWRFCGERREFITLTESGKWN